MKFNGKELTEPTTFTIEGVEYEFDGQHLKQDDVYYYDGEYFLHRNMMCNLCFESGEVVMAEERYCMGVYAGKYCDTHWDQSGYRKDEKFDPTYAGEALEPEDY